MQSFNRTCSACSVLLDVFTTYFDRWTSRNPAGRSPSRASDPLAGAQRDANTSFKAMTAYPAVHGLVIRKAVLSFLAHLPEPPQRNQAVFGPDKPPSQRCLKKWRSFQHGFGCTGLALLQLARAVSQPGARLAQVADWVATTCQPLSTVKLLCPR